MSKNYDSTSKDDSISSTDISEDIILENDENNIYGPNYNFIINDNWSIENKNAYKYLICINPLKVDHKRIWFNIAVALYNSKCTFDIFDEWCKLSKYYNNKSNKLLWDETTNRKIPLTQITMDTIIELARKDNYKNNFNKINNNIDKESLLKYFKNDNYLIEIYEEYLKEIFLSPNITDNNIAELFYGLYSDNYLYDGENMAWYTCNKFGIFFRDTEELLTCRRKLTLKLVPIITKIYTIFYDIYKNDKNSLDIANKNYLILNKSLTSITRKKLIIEQLKEYYYIKKFREKMNGNKYLFAFDNGVYDLKTYEFRRADAKELVFETTGYEYTESTEEDKLIVIKTIRDMFVDEDLYNYFMTILSLRLVKINELEEFYFMIGNASNGKGLITSLIENTFGKFAQTLNSNTFSQTKHGVHAEAASPAIASTYNSNIVFVNELSNKMKITADILKKISGNDKIKTRFLRENFFEFIPGYSLFFVSNFEPVIDGSDGGIQRRLRFIPFNVTFSDNPDPNKHEKKINRELKQQFKQTNFCCAFFDILVSYYKKYIDNEKKIDVPEIVKYKSKEFLNDNDPVKLFVESCIEITNNNKDKIYASHLMDSFINYNGGQSRGYNLDKLKKRLTIDFNIECKRTASGIAYIGIKEIYDE